jgi:adenylosuccinate synthase
VPLQAYIVVDLGFGDSGKGLLTDFLVRHFHAGLVVRYNGGAQAGHHVTTPNGREHTFSQFGAGTFNPGVKTYLSKHMVIHPGALLVEGDILAQKGVLDPFSRLRISEQALVITPFHQAANRLRELARGRHRHGSCGVGVGEAVEHASAHPEDCILAGDLGAPQLLRRKAARIRDQVRHQLSGLSQDAAHVAAASKEWEVFEDEGLIDRWIDSISPIEKLGLVVNDQFLKDGLRQNEAVVFEGAQGVLLDGNFGFHPYTTWSNCTAANALDLLSEHAPGSEVRQIGVARSHAVRHGPGPLPTETEALTGRIHDHNVGNPWQGPVRYGWFDAVLLRYALKAVGGVDGLAITHLDMLKGLNEWMFCDGYETGLNSSDDPIDVTESHGMLTGFQISSSTPLTVRDEFTRSLMHATPVLQTCPANEKAVIHHIERLLGSPVNLVARGPISTDMEFRIDL